MKTRHRRLVDVDNRPRHCGAVTAVRTLASGFDTQVPAVLHPGAGRDPIHDDRGARPDRPLEELLEPARPARRHTAKVARPSIQDGVSSGT